MFAKTTKALVAALVVAGFSLGVAATASASPIKFPTKAEQDWMNRASQNVDGGGN